MCCPKHARTDKTILVHIRTGLNAMMWYVVYQEQSIKERKPLVWPSTHSKLKTWFHLLFFTKGKSIPQLASCSLSWRMALMKSSSMSARTEIVFRPEDENKHTTVEDSTFETCYGAWSRWTAHGLGEQTAAWDNVCEDWMQQSPDVSPYASITTLPQFIDDLWMISVTATPTPLTHTAPLHHLPRQTIDCQHPFNCDGPTLSVWHWFYNHLAAHSLL